MKNFIEAFKIAVLDFFSGKSENESIDNGTERLRVDSSGIHHHFPPSYRFKPDNCLSFGDPYELPLPSPPYKDSEGNIGFGTPSQIKEESKVVKENKINKISNKKVKTKSKPKKVLNITIIHNKKPVTITEFSKISGIPYPVIKYHYYANNIKTSKELKNHLKPETLERVKVKL